jgi:hypothetical protein
MVGADLLEIRTALVNATTLIDQLLGPEPPINPGGENGPG